MSLFVFFILIWIVATFFIESQQQRFAVGIIAIVLLLLMLVAPLPYMHVMLTR